MDAVRDLLLGRPRVGQAPSHLLAGEATVPYGREPSPEIVEAAWKLKAGDRPNPPWLLLGHRDTPNGTVWRLAWCPPAGRHPLPGRCEVVLPDAAWAFSVLDNAQGPAGWHVRIAQGAPEGIWTGIWEGDCCDRLLGPFPDEPTARDKVAQHLLHDGIQSESEVAVPWTGPSSGRILDIAQARPESDLLPPPLSMERAERRANAAALARIGAILVALASISLALFGWQSLESGRLQAEQRRLAPVQPIIRHVRELREADARLGDSIFSRGAAAIPNSSADRVVSGLSRKVPEGTTLQALQMESSGDGWRIRTEARLASWDQVQILAQSLRAAPGVAKVSVVAQNRAEDHVSATLEIQGNWP